MIWDTQEFFIQTNKLYVKNAQKSIQIHKYDSSKQLYV